MVWVNAVVQGILLGGLYALFAAGLSLIFGVMRLVNLAHGDLSVVAAYLSLALVDLLGINPLLSVVIVVPIMFALGVVLQYLMLNDTVGPDPMPSILVTFGLAIIIQNLLLETFSADSQGLDAGRIEGKALGLVGDLAVGWFPLLTFAVAVVVLVGLQLYLSRTRIGRALRATSDDQSTARLMGINNKRIFALAMGVSLALAGIAGIMLGIRTTFMPAAGSMLLIFGYEAVIIGGLGSIWGTLAGGILLGVAQTIGAQIDPGWGVLTGHLLFLAVLAIRPQGLFARKEIR